MLEDTNSSEARFMREVAAHMRTEVQLQEKTQELSQKIHELELATSALKLRHRAIEASANAVIITSAVTPDFIIEYVNPAFERITGYSAAETVGRNCKFLQGDDGDQPGLNEIRAALREQREGNAVLRNYRKDKSPYWNHLYVAPVSDGDGIVTHFVASQYDITASRNDEAKLMQLAYHDELTGLPNRALLRERLLQTIASARCHERHVWVVLISLDRFKSISDCFGHIGSDRVLKVMADRLRDAVGDSHTLARWGGHEFAIVMPKQPDSELATAALQQIMAEVNRAIPIGGQESFLTCSMGVSEYPQDGEDVDTLIDRAHVAVYHARIRGRNNFRFHTAEMNQMALRRLRIEGDLRLAIEREEFVLHYQPQVDLSSGQVIGMEALIRWQHPERGLVYPSDFIGIAEETGLIIPIGAWVLRAACRQNGQWQHDGLPRMRIAVNLSALQFSQQNLAGSIAAVLAESGIAPEDLELELTESLIMSDVDQSIDILRDIKALGVRISVDDFGTGYSSLSYLKRLPINALKIDRSFVSDIGAGDGDDAAIATSIITLAHAFKLQVIAEGVETMEQITYLRRNGCDELQGYYFSKPIGAVEFAQMLRSGKRLELELADRREMILTSSPL